VFDADGRNAARKWRIEINNWRPITVPLNEFASARLGAAVASLWEALAIFTSASSSSCQNPIATDVPMSKAVSKASYRRQ